MAQGWTLILFKANGRRSFRFTITKATLVWVLLLCVMGAALGLLMGWKIGEMTSQRAAFRVEARV